MNSVSLDVLLDEVIQKKASDLHIIPGYAPTLRMNNELVALSIMGVVTPDMAQALLVGVLNDGKKDILARQREIDFGIAFKGERFRVNYCYAQGALSASFRWIPAAVRSIDDLGLPSVFHDFSRYTQGLVLFTGPTGEGKSTSLAAIINEINTRDAKHILTIEDPIEFIYPHAKAIVTQRELLQDTLSWQAALKSALREDPDVVLIGEMRDFETIKAALTVAETGHLVFATLHTGTTPDAVNRIIDVFPSGQQNQVRNQLSTVLRAVVSQRLLVAADKVRRVPAVEVLMNIPSVGAIIREGKTYMLDNVLETEERNNMILFEKHLARLYQQGVITRETAYAHALRIHELTKFIP